MTYYARTLPHWQPAGKNIFLTWRLSNTLPVAFSRSLNASTANSAGKRFRVTDAELDKARYGPVWLKDARVAKCVVDAIRRGEQELNFYRLDAYVVMPNHVHILIEPGVPLARVTHRVKGTSARAANKILGLESHRFWQDESFDHWVRSAAEFMRIKNYIEHNPVKAGLVNFPADWLWSSAAK